MLRFEMIASKFVHLATTQLFHLQYFDTAILTIDICRQTLLNSVMNFSFLKTIYFHKPGCPPQPCPQLVSPSHLCDAASVGFEYVRRSLGEANV